MQTLLVFSHLRWDFVYQRPQHLLSRLAKHYRVLFFEEPVRGQTPYLERLQPSLNLEVLRPHTTVDAPGFHDDQLSELKPLLAEYLSESSISDYLVWFYTPMALPLLADLHPRAVIYDCMDELSAFRNCPPQMVQRESALMKRAQIVFTGGPSLFQAKRRRHGNVQCFPSAVDAAHFSQGIKLNGASRGASSPHVSLPVAASKDARRSGWDQEAHRMHASIARPRLGFFGVIDERFDIELVAAVADRAPGWQFVFVGPVVKIDPASLPQRANVHWMGQQSYEMLPHLVAQWDVCLLPFACNESTRFISPTKTLEYMAAEKPIVSTPIRDVMDLYSDSVAIADSADQFLSACQAALSESATERGLRITRMRAHVDQCTWDLTARRIHAEIEAELRRKDASVAAMVVGADRSVAPATRSVGALLGRATDRTVAESAIPTPAG